MAIYFKLVKREYNGNEVGEIISNINENILKKYGLSIERIDSISKDGEVIYKLEEKEMGCEKSDIGGIIFEMFNYIEESKFGISLNLIAGAIEDYYEIIEKVKCGEYQILNEEILWRNMSDNEKTAKIKSYLKKVGDDIDELIIIDPYMFSARRSEQQNKTYINLLIKITKILNPNEIIFITNKNNEDEKVKEDFKKIYEGTFQIKYSKEWHDRFWITNRNKGIMMGTSLNGMGSKISSIMPLNKEDVKELLEYMDENNLINREVKKECL